MYSCKSDFIIGYEKKIKHVKWYKFIMNIILKYVLCFVHNIRNWKSTDQFIH